MGSARSPEFGGRPGRTGPAPPTMVAETRAVRGIAEFGVAKGETPMSGLDLLDPDRRALFIGGRWREAESGKRFPVLDPADGSTLTDVADAAPVDAMAALDAAAGAQADWARTAPRERGEILRRAFEPARGASRRLRRAGQSRDGQDAGRGQGRGALRRRVLALVQRGGRADPRPLDAGPGGREPPADDAQAGRPLPVHHAVELPARDGHPQDRPGGGRRAAR